MKKRNPALLTPVQLAGLRARLVAARRRVLRTLGTLRDGAGAEESGGSEFEERSQVGTLAAVDARLAEGEFARLRQIEGALHRMVLDTYGLCTRSASPIAVERLLADPALALCPECAVLAETESAGPFPAEDRAEARLPADLRGFDDAELAGLVRETFRQEIGGGLAGMRVACRRGRVILAGEVPSDELRQVAVQVVEDELGLAVVDRVRVTGGGDDGRPAAEDGPVPVPEDLGLSFGEGDGGSADLFAVDEEGLSYTPPLTPVPGLE